MNLNKIFLLGRVASDPEIRTTASGQPVCSFRMVTNRIFKNQAGQKQENPEFHSIVLWRRLAEIASQYFSKGALVFIEGRIQTRSWQDNQGNKKYRTEVVAERMQLGPRANPAVTKPENPGSESAAEEIPIIEEKDDEIDVKEIPF